MKCLNSETQWTQTRAVAELIRILDVDSPFSPRLGLTRHKPALRVCKWAHTSVLHSHSYKMCISYMGDIEEVAK